MGLLRDGDCLIVSCMPNMVHCMMCSLCNVVHIKWEGFTSCETGRGASSVGLGVGVAGIQVTSLCCKRVGGDGGDREEGKNGEGGELHRA